MSLYNMPQKSVQIIDFLSNSYKTCTMGRYLKKEANQIFFLIHLYVMLGGFLTIYFDFFKSWVFIHCEKQHPFEYQKLSWWNLDFNSTASLENSWFRPGVISSRLSYKWARWANPLKSSQMDRHTKCKKSNFPWIENSVKKTSQFSNVLTSNAKKTHSQTN
jgi:hypothetical protein